jgi:hypothetical protein
LIVEYLKFGESLAKIGIVTLSLIDQTITDATQEALSGGDLHAGDHPSRFPNRSPAHPQRPQPGVASW